MLEGVDYSSSDLIHATHYEVFAAYFQIQNTEEKCKTLEKSLVKYEESESKINGEFLAGILFLKIDFYLIYISRFSVGSSIK